MEIFRDERRRNSTVYLTARDLEDRRSAERLRGYMIRFLLIPIEYRHIRTEVLDYILPAMSLDGEICYY